MAARISCSASWSSPGARWSGSARANATFRWTRPLAGFDRRDQARIAAALLFACAGLAHVLAGSLVSISRYEIYVILLGLGTMLVVFDRPAEALFSRMGPGPAPPSAPPSCSAAPAMRCAASMR